MAKAATLVGKTIFVTVGALITAKARGRAAQRNLSIEEVVVPLPEFP